MCTSFESVVSIPEMAEGLPTLRNAALPRRAAVACLHCVAIVSLANPSRHHHVVILVTNVAISVLFCVPQKSKSTQRCAVN